MGISMTSMSILARQEREKVSTYFVRVHQGATPPAVLRQLLLLHQPVGEASLTGHLCLRYDKNEPQEFPFGDQRGGEKVVTGRVCVSSVWKHSRNCMEGQQSRKCSKYTSGPNTTYDSRPTPKRWSSCTSPLSSLCGLVQHVHGWSRPWRSAPRKLPRQTKVH